MTTALRSEAATIARKFLPGATGDEITGLLDRYARKLSIRNLAGFVSTLGQQGQLVEDLEALRAGRQLEEDRKILAEAEQMPACEHGMPGGEVLHPASGLPRCPLCRQAALDRQAEAGNSVSPRSLNSGEQDLGDTGDSGVSPDNASIYQAEHSTGDTGDTRDTATPGGRAIWTAAELMAEDFPAPRWAVGGLIPEGVTLLAGAPKVGKSWLALGLCAAVAVGGKALGYGDVVQGPALYMALEDTPRRLQNRLRKVVAQDGIPEGLALTVECPPLSSGGAEYISGWLGEHPDARIVIIDVFERIRGPIPPSTSAYTADYLAVRSVKQIADHFGVAIVLIHHTRKMSSGDVLNEVSGTLGLSGAADTIAVLKRARGELDGTLSITGRDVEENEYAMKFATDAGAWQLLGPAGDYGLSDTRRQVLAHIKTHDGARPKETAAATGLDHEVVKKTLKRMADDGQLHTDGRGRYYLPTGVPSVPET